MTEDYNPGIKGGCRTTIADGHPHDVTFTTRNGKTLLTITPDGKLVLGDGVSKDTASRQVGAMILDYFGYAYKSELTVAIKKAEEAEQKMRKAERELDEWKARAYKAENRLVRESDIEAKLRER